MDHSGAPANSSKPGAGQRGYPVRGSRGVGQADAFRGGFNRPHPGIEEAFMEDEEDGTDMTVMAEALVAIRDSIMGVLTDVGQRLVELPAATTTGGD
jgi:hypothetical protein